MLKLINRKDAAQILGVSVQTLDRLRAKGELKGGRIGDLVKFSEQEIQDFIESKFPVERQPA